MLAALLRPWASELLAVVLRYDVALFAVVLSVSTHMLTSTTRVLPARLDEEIAESLPWDGLPEDLFTWTRAFFTGLLLRIQELNGRLESGSGPELDVEQVQRDFMDITTVLLAMVGCWPLSKKKRRILTRNNHACVTSQDKLVAVPADATSFCRPASSHFASGPEAAKKRIIAIYRAIRNH
mmetsp:Transcript_53378/g.125203  ORF Transcript_53378/g.125203 Transcript_53378/m.125203 type:complete len:181 (-) Transcript_53378:218-760(-)